MKHRRAWMGWAMPAVIAMCCLAVVPAWSAEQKADDAKAPAATGPIGEEKVTAQQQLEFRQRKVIAHMRELEERMFRLSELIRETEPENAARLMLALEKARKELIVDDMKDVLGDISQNRLDRSAKQQQKVVEKLEEIRELLLSTDLDMQMQLARLRKLNEAIKKLDKVIEEQARQNDRGDELSDKQNKGAPLGKAPQQLGEDQKANQRSTDDLKESLKDVESKDGKAGKSLGKASESMGGAAGKLGEGNPKDAKGDQSDAKKKLEEAKKDLERQRDELKKQLEDMIRAQLMDDLYQMLDAQRKITKQTEQLGPLVKGGNEQAVLGVKSLGPEEQRIDRMMDKTLRLLEETDFSIVLPPALRAVQRQVIYVVADLNAGRANTFVVAAEKQIERDLELLIDAIKSSAPPPNQSQGEGKCKSCGQDKNKLVSELKMLRLLQMRVNGETVEADQRRAQDGDLTPLMRERIGTIKAHQQEVREATEKIHRMTCKHCLES
ncbi:MAG: hypothetical protein GC159_15815 [Phycisphaera sp.]|nr:hypothetical protein [Phycisphaera sp.]